VQSRGARVGDEVTNVSVEALTRFRDDEEERCVDAGQYASDPLEPSPAPAACSTPSPGYSATTRR
jgi:hypothetical protein